MAFASAKHQDTHGLAVQGTTTIAYNQHAQTGT